jgi:hypothetical protein
MPLLILCLFIFSISLDAFLNGYQRRDLNLVFGLLVIFTPPLGHLVGLILGIAGIRQAERKKLFSVLGIVLNTLFLLLAAAIATIFMTIIVAAL